MKSDPLASDCEQVTTSRRRPKLEPDRRSRLALIRVESMQQGSDISNKLNEV
jgi:hypothetical protein